MAIFFHAQSAQPAPVHWAGGAPKESEEFDGRPPESNQPAHVQARGTIRPAVGRDDGRGIRGTRAAFRPPLHERSALLLLRRSWWRIGAAFGGPEGKEAPRGSLWGGRVIPPPARFGCRPSEKTLWGKGRRWRRSARRSRVTDWGHSRAGCDEQPLSVLGHPLWRDNCDRLGRMTTEIWEFRPVAGFFFPSISVAPVKRDGGPVFV